jgi:acetylornithine deacetylase/succinyl-diaminopimelate desuccinylase-like protein
VAASVIAPPFRCDFDVIRHCPPYAIDGGNQTAMIARDAVRAVQRTAAFGMDSAANDSSWMHQHGIETVLLGPGAPEQAHVTDEHVSAEELSDAVRIYAAIGASTHVKLAEAFPPPNAH